MLYLNFQHVINIYIFTQFGILFKFNGEFSNLRNTQQFYHIVVKLNTSLDIVFQTWLNSKIFSKYMKFTFTHSIWRGYSICKRKSHKML